MGERLIRLAARVRRGMHRACRREDDPEALADVAAGLDAVLGVLCGQRAAAAHLAATAELTPWSLCAQPSWQAIVWAEAEEYMRRAAEDAGAVDLDAEPAESARLTRYPSDPPGERAAGRTG
jgi:hypothetical protein